MSKMYAYMTTTVYRPDESTTAARGSTIADAQWFAAELNRLLAERDEARRDRDVLAVFIRGGAPLNHGEYFAALSRCTPPATCPNREVKP